MPGDDPAHVHHGAHGMCVDWVGQATPEVLAFGCVLYEMATGSELEELRQIKRLPTTCPEAVREV